ncbi:MAG: PilZ domain-containing protein, partial [Gammaproteobacteria bacterium]|nr:PilZ domain-containing protein [Gammaproteobacteria bacterium]
MERRRHNRIPVELNAVLIGEKTVPKGCRVSNISQQGLLLTCVADGRVSTFRKGNIVNVHLLFQQSGGCKYLTKTADVRHAGENSIGVEFHQPDSKLVEFLKPSHTESNHNLDTASAGISASVNEGIDMHNATNADFMDKAPGITAATQAREPEIPVTKDRMVFYTGLASLVIAAGLALGAYLYTSNINTRISTLETVTEKHTSELTEVQEWALSASMLEGKFAYLNAQLKALIDSFAKLENRLTAGIAQPPVKIVAQTDSPAAETGIEKTTAGPARIEAAEPPAADTGMTAVDTGQITAAAEPPVTVTDMTAVDTGQITAAAEPPVAVTDMTAVDTIRRTTTAEPPAAVTDMTAVDTIR